VISIIKIGNNKLRESYKMEGPETQEAQQIQEEQEQASPT